MWLIAKDKRSGRLFMVHRSVREHQLKLWASNGITVPSIVVKSFHSSEDACDYLTEMFWADDLITTTLKKRR